MQCPACHHGEGSPNQRHTASDAAQHFVPRQRDRDRHDRLKRHLIGLWGRDHVDIYNCASCGFGYAVPFVGGDAEFYALAHAGDTHYPSARWEFDRTLATLPPTAKLAEVGAGDGAFLDRLPPGLDVVAAEYDAGAINRLHEKGYDALQGSVDEIAERGPFEVICMFQTLEHMADIDHVFATLRTALAPSGHIFLSVPNADATLAQERLTGLWDMPPNHVGRWTGPALEAVAQRHGLACEIELEPVPTRTIAWQLAVSAVNADSYVSGSLAGRVNSITHRPARGVAKRLLALRYLPRLIARRKEFAPWTCWAHLQPA